jgi:hypothetical protein
VKIKKFNESIGKDEIESLFSYAKDLASSFAIEIVGGRIRTGDEHEIYCYIDLEHKFYDLSSYDNFSNYVKMVVEVDDVCNKLINIYKLSVSFEEKSNSIITIVIRLK